MTSLSIIILTFNEELNLPACLESLKGLSADLFVVDSGSTDRTADIARAAGATVVVHPFENYAAQRNWSLQNLSLNTPWTLSLDADERLMPALSCEILDTLSSAPQDVAGFLLRKRTIFMGRWIRHGGHYPSFHLRLFRTGKGRCEDRLYDQHFMVDGRTLILTNDYIDIVASDLDVWLSRHIRWADLEAQELSSVDEPGGQVAGRAFGNPIERRRWLRKGLYGKLPLYFRALAYGFYRIILRGGFLDGREGLVFHFLQGCWFRFLVDVKLDAIRHRTAVS